jgi:hypothetical protein
MNGNFMFPTAMYWDGSIRRPPPPHRPLCREGNEKLSNKNKLNHLHEKSVKNFAALLKAEGNLAKSKK